MNLLTKKIIDVWKKERVKFLNIELLYIIHPYFICKCEKKVSFIRNSLNVIRNQSPLTRTTYTIKNVQTTKTNTTF